MKNTKVVKIGDLGIGGDNPVRVESMLKISLRNNLSQSLQELQSLEAAGCELVRVAIPDKETLPLVSRIREHSNLPLMADIHFSKDLALGAIREGVDSIRINPGNMRLENVREIVRAARRKSVPLRIGVNAASFKQPLGSGEDSARKLAQTLYEYVEEIEKEDFYDLIVSIKSSDVLTTVKANQEIASQLPYPIHLGITEAGIPPEGVVKSAIGLGILLSQGIGDTLRVSLTSSSAEEVEVGYQILRALNLRQHGVSIISCPTCGRCKIDVLKIAREVKKRLSHIKEPLKIAVMGCEVNGPGEAKEADIGIAGGVGGGLLFKKGKHLKKIKAEKLVDTLLREVKEMLPSS